MNETTTRRIVLDRLPWMANINRAIYFGACVPQDPSQDWDTGVEVKLTPQAWADIGLPEKLTVTLEAS